MSDQNCQVSDKGMSCYGNTPFDVMIFRNCDGSNLSNHALRQILCFNPNYVLFLTPCAVFDNSPELPGTLHHVYNIDDLICQCY